MSEDPRITPPSPPCEPSKKESDGWLSKLMTTVQCLGQDVEAVLDHDPAARSKAEVVLTYPGLHALWGHRVAHALWKRERPLAARVLSHANRFLTGVEIHPGAHIGRGVFIDHGMGVVIGETARVGDGCILFKGVVLGGTSMKRGQLRHPQLGEHVVVGTNACVLGDVRVGDGARIGSGSVVIRSVGEGATVVGVPGREGVAGGDRRARFDATLDHASLPDPVATMLRSLRDENERLRARLEQIERRMDIEPEDDDLHEHHLVDGSLATTDLPPQHGG